MAEPKHLGPNAEQELHTLFQQTLIDLEHYLALHAAFDQWLITHPALGVDPPSENS